MKTIILLLCLIIFAPFAAHAYKHKSEAEIAQMTPAQRVDEYAAENTYHGFRFDDEQPTLIKKYILLDGAKAFPRTAEIINEYDPTRSSGKSGQKAEHFDAMWEILISLDEFIVRVRASESGRQTIIAFERAIERMRAAGYEDKDEVSYKNYSRYRAAVRNIEYLKGINSVDTSVKETFWLEYRIKLSEAEMLELSNFLTGNYSDYPSWSKTIYFRDMTRFNYAGNPFWIRTFREPKRYYEKYLEFEKTKN